MKINIQHVKLWDAGKSVLRGKFVALNACFRKEGWFQINNPSSYLKKLEKEEKNKPEANSRWEITDKNRKLWNQMQENTEKTRKQRADEKYQKIRGKLRLRKKMEVKCEQDTENTSQKGKDL